MKKSFFISLILFFANFTVFAQPPLDWVTTSSANGAGNDNTEDVFVDASGNAYACGTFTGALDIGTFNLNAGLNKQTFIVKYDPTGIVLWAVESTGDGNTFGYSIFVDAIGCTYVTGTSSNSTLTFGSQSVPAAGSEDVYIVKLDPNGFPIHLIGPDPASTDKAESFAITGNGDDVFITGYFKNGPLVLGGNTTGPDLGQEDLFIANVDSALSATNWIVAHGSAKTEQGYGIAIDGNDVFVTGFFSNDPMTIFAAGTDYILPDFSNENIFVLNCARNNGATNWATHAGFNGKSKSYDVVAESGNLYITGFFTDTCKFNATESKSGPFTYSDTLFGNGGQDIFAAHYNYNGDLLNIWSEGGVGDDIGWGITVDPTCSEVEICGEFENAVTFGSTDILTANAQDIFVSAYSLVGAYSWAFQESSSGSEKAKSISANNGRTSVGGDFNSNTTFSTSGGTTITNSGLTDHFVSSFQCANSAACGPSITCPPNDTVTADASCNFIMTDYVGTETVVDGCALGYSVTQDISEFTVLSAGTHPVTMTVTDNVANTDQCIFNLVIEANVNPVIVNCGDLLVSQNSSGAGNTQDTWTCDPTTTSGEDVYYQITVPTGNYLLGTKITNATDTDDSELNVFWINGSCPLTTTCLSSDQFDLSSQNFVSNNQNQLLFNAAGPGTFYFVVDSENAGSSTFDIEFNCIVSGVEFDESNCSLNDLDQNGVFTTIDGASTLKVDQCQTATFCHEIYIKNVNAGEWMDTVVMDLGSCYTNVTNFTPTAPGPNGFYNGAGTWNAVYDGANNSIQWGFNHSSGNDWGEGPGTNYSCATYEFCFDADISSTCMNNDSLKVSIYIEDDAVDGAVPGVAQGFDYAYGDSLSLLNIPDPSWSMPATSFCQSESDPTPTISGTTGGTFTSTAGLVWFDQPNGIIDLSASTVGNYNITYSIGLCPTDSIINIDITLSDDASFTYAATYCQGDTDPVANITGEIGGTFSGPAGLVFLNPTTGLIDLSASTPGGPYTIKYVTNDPCKDSTTFDITINAEDDPFFDYPQNTYCSYDTDPAATNIATGGGTFTGPAGVTILNPLTGLIDLDASTAGGPYAIKYVTSGICPDSTTFNITINQADDPFFDYPQNAYCSYDSDPSATNIATGGGTFSEASGSVTFLNTGTGLIDLDASTAGGPYTIKYLTSGICPDSTTFNITINQADDPFFDYPQNTYCSYDADPAATNITTGGGTFTGPAGVTILNPLTGLIDLDASTAGGPYAIKYVTSGICPDSTTFNITINQADDPFFDYPQNAYCSYDSDPSATNIATGGGTFSEASGSVSFLNSGTGLIDLDASTPGGPYTIKYLTSGICPDSTTFNITINQADDPFFDYPQSAYCSYDTDPAATNIATGGGTFSEAGGSVTFLNNGTGLIDLDASTAGGPYAIKYLTSGICPDSTTFNITINQADDPFFDYPQNTYCSYDADPAATNIATGGGTFSEASGSVSFLNTGTGLIDLDASTPGGPYTIKYVTSGICPDSTTFNITINQADDPIFDYPQNTYCSYDTDPAATNITTGGGTFTGPAGVTILNPLTGLIDLDASTAGGPYAIKYVTAGICPDSTTFNITINQADDPFFDYPQSAYCSYDADPAATNIATGGGTFSEAGGSVTFLNTGTGLIDLDASTPGGPYTIKYLTSGICPDSTTFNITINQADDPFFDYPQSAYCSYDTDPAATNIATGGGTFSEASGSVTFLNSGTGLIDLDASTAGGPYVVQYLTPGICPDSTTFNITINQADDPFFDYPQSAYCSYDADPAATNIATGGGTFSEASGSVTFLNNGTGLIDLDASTSGGPYTIKYLTSGICPDSTTFNITINQADDPFFDYPQSAYCSYDTDPAATNIATGGGTFSEATASVTFLNTTTGLIDLDASTAGGPYVVQYLTPGICPDSTTFNITINQADDPFFDYPQNAYCSYDADPAATNIATGGGTFSEAGGSVTFLNTGIGLIDLDASIPGGPYTIKYLTSGICPDSTTFNITINQADDPFFDYPQSAYCSYDTDPAATNIATGGGTFTEATASVTFLNTTTGLIDLDASTAGGPYVVQYLTPGICPDSTTFNITINQADDASISYLNSVFCNSDTNEDTLSVGTNGGSFTSNSSSIIVGGTSGQINVANSQPGVYQVYYTTAGICPSIDSVEITINPEDDATFSYSDLMYCNNDANQDTVVVGTNGGTFTASSGNIDVDAVSGQVNLSNSLPGVYQIYYTTNGICPNIDSVDITINAEDDPAFGYALTSFCNYDQDEDTLFVTTSGGTFSSSSTDFIVNPASGILEISASQSGIYNVYYTTPGPLCPNTDSIEITIHAIDDPYFMYADEYCISESNPLPVVNLAGGTFSSLDTGIVLDANSGLIDLTNSVADVTYEIQYLTADLCPDSTTILVTLHDLPVADAGPDQSLNYQFETQLEGIISGDYSEWVVNSGTGIVADAEDPQSIIESLSAGENELTLYVTNGTCPEVEDELVIIVSELWVPEVVTPNGDGKNDTFTILGIENGANNVQIFNRWGQIVFESENYQNDWDGYSNKGTMLEDETYFYVITVDDLKFKGYVVLKR